VLKIDGVVDGLVSLESLRELSVGSRYATGRELALRAIHEEIAEVKDEQKSQRDRIDRIRDQIKASYAGATITGGSLASAIAASIKPG
jgi:hypothetical protein